MYKVIIVEDEMLVRIGLKNSVEWGKFGMEVAADFSDGLAAWEYYEREKPDVVITDICMPKMDGMELIANIRKAEKHTRIVVLSCLEEFELARKALALDVSSYILKLTMTEQEIEEVLNGIRDELESQERSAAARTDSGMSASSLDLVKEKMFKDFLFYNIFSAEEFGRFAAQSGLRLTPVRLVACVMEVDRYTQLKERFRDDYGHLVKMSLLNILDEIMSVHKRGEVIQINERQYALILHFGDFLSEQSIVQETGRILGGIQDAIRLYFNSSVSFGVSGIRGGYDALPKLYAEAQRTLERKFLTGPGQQHRGDQPADNAGVQSRFAALRECELLRKLLSPGKQAELDALLDGLERVITGDRKTLEVRIFHCMQWINAQLYHGGENERLLGAAEQLERCDTLPDMLDQLIGHAEQSAGEISNRLHRSDEITRAIQYIKLHYTENISLQMVADYVGLSFSYLSNLFRKELNISYIDYLNRYRIERAKELLTETQLKSADIAVRVGFSPEYTYFSKVFKKITGRNPNEYRRQKWNELKRKA